MSVSEGDTMPDIAMVRHDGEEVKASDYRGRKLAVFFYPKDNTPGCTQEGQDFRDLHAEFQAAGAQILGVSRESIRSHENFKAKFEFPFELLSDPDETLCKAYDVMKEKNMYGRKYMGVERSTFVIDPQGMLRHEWRKVKVKGHAQAVLDAVKSI